MKLLIDEDKIDEVAEVLKSEVKSLEVDDFTNPLLYPPVNASRRTILQYFLVLVAMDHRLSRPNRPYEGYVDGMLFHGADLLYRLGVKKLEEDPAFFDAESLAKITAKDVIDWLSVRGEKIASPPDPDVRAMLLRDLGLKILRLYDGDPYLIITTSKGFLKSQGSGFIEILRVFLAYNDPVEKKSYLLAKFLERRGVLAILDNHNKEVPVDNHLVRIALRLGLIDVDQKLLEKIAFKIEFSESEDVAIRFVTRLAYKRLSARAGIDPFILDDYLWSFGRKICSRDNPKCRTKNECPLANICRASRNPLYMTSEHFFYNTWWY